MALTHVHQRPTRPWQEVAREAQQHRDSTIASIRPVLPPLCPSLPKDVTGIPRQVLLDREAEITSLPLDDLLHRLGGRGLAERLSAVEVVNAFLRRAAIAQRLTNCLTELMFSQALKRARELDAYFEEHGVPMGPLHGLPISVKEHIGIKGLRLHGSSIASWDTIAIDDAHVLQIMVNAGAVFHARTTQPQTLMHLETSSNFYGTTCNPYNSDLSSGGSSGGEGALIGLGGSVLGIGSDVGGSIRSPAANNGIYGFRPSSFRVPTDGWSCAAANLDEIPGVIGPLSSSLDGIELFMKVVAAAKPWLSEPALLPLPWAPYQVNAAGHLLNIAVMWHDDVVLPHPPITRALRTMVAKLNELPDIRVSRWKPHLHDKAWRIISSLYYPDGGHETLESLDQSGEPLLPLTDWMMRNPYVRNLSPRDLLRWKADREEYRNQYAKLWSHSLNGADDDIDAILCPAGPGLAPRHDTARYWGYTSQWNLLDYPAIVFPVCKAHADIDSKERTVDMMTQADEYNWNLYEPGAFDGVPVSLQLVCRRYNDEKVVGVLRYLKDALRLPFGNWQ